MSNLIPNESGTESLDGKDMRLDKPYMFIDKEYYAITYKPAYISYKKQCEDILFLTECFKQYCKDIKSEIISFTIEDDPKMVKHIHGILSVKIGRSPVYKKVKGWYSFITIIYDYEGWDRYCQKQQDFIEKEKSLVLKSN